MYECAQMFGAVRGQEICDMVEDATGEPCPCMTGGKCPLIAGQPVTLKLLTFRDTEAGAC